jgi:hypothetical protein
MPWPKLGALAIVMVDHDLNRMAIEAIYKPEGILCDQGGGTISE